MTKFDRIFGKFFMIAPMVASFVMFYFGFYGAWVALLFLAAVQGWFYSDSVNTWKTLEEIRQHHAEFKQYVDELEAMREAMRKAD